MSRGLGERDSRTQHEPRPQAGPLFPGGFPQRNFALMKNETFFKGLIALTYKRARGKTKKKN
jgi:hypothetical protein